MDYSHVMHTIVVETITDPLALLTLRAVSSSLLEAATRGLDRLLDWSDFPPADEQRLDVTQTDALRWLRLPMDQASALRAAVPFRVKRGPWCDMYLFDRLDVLHWALASYDGFSGWVSRIRKVFGRHKRHRELVAEAVCREARKVQRRERAVAARDARLRKLLGIDADTVLRVLPAECADAVFGDFVDASRLTCKTTQRELREMRAVDVFTAIRCRYTRWMRGREDDALAYKVWTRVLARSPASAPELHELQAELEAKLDRRRAKIEARLRSQAERDDRKDQIVCELARVGCTLRADSHLCREFIDSGRNHFASVRLLAEEMALMRWLYEYRGFHSRLQNKVDFLSGYGDEYYEGIYADASQALVQEMRHEAPAVWPWMRGGGGGSSAARVDGL